MSRITIDNVTAAICKVSAMSLREREELAEEISGASRKCWPAAWFSRG
jgi:hypothetical protein